MTATWRKSRALFAIYFQEGLAYRASGLIWVMTDVTTAVTMPLVWAAAAKSGTIAGFSTSDFVLYYLCLLLIQCFVTSHIMWDVAMEIKEGQFVTSLLRPVNWYLLTFIRNLAWRVFRPLLFLPFFFLFLWLYRGMLGDAHIGVTPAFLLSVVLGHVLSFSMVTMLSLIALFTQEAMSIFELYYLPALLLSGSVFPVSVMPPWAQSIAHVLPFYVTAGAPTEILIGRLGPADVPRVILTQIVWIAVCYLGFRYLWSRGLPRYSGAGN